MVTSDPSAPQHAQGGGTLVMVVVFMVALFGMAALAIDVGNMYTQRHRIQEAIDSAALASVRSWAAAVASTEVIATAQNFAMMNGAAQADIQTVEPGYWVLATRTFVGPLSSLPAPLPAGAAAAVRVTARKTVRMSFAAIVGFREMSPRLEAIAIASLAKSAIRVVPWAMCFDNVPKIPCTLVTLKWSSVDYSLTNSCRDVMGRSQHGALSLGQPGADNYRDNIINGYPGILRVGDCVLTEPGDMNGPTTQGLEARLQGLPPYTCTANPQSEPPNNKRLAIVPAITSLQLNGRAQVCITGFYVVVLDDIDYATGAVNGRYLYTYQGTEVDASASPVAGQPSAIGLVK